MILKIWGAVLIVAGCGFCGFRMAHQHKKEETTLRQMVALLDYMECELQYRLTSLPELFHNCGQEATGVLKNVFLDFTKELNDQISPDAAHCMQVALQNNEDIPRLTFRALKDLSKQLGKFDLDGQLKGLESCRAQCRRELEKLTENQATRLRNYQTLGLCAGAALAILFV